MIQLLFFVCLGVLENEVQDVTLTEIVPQQWRMTLVGHCQKLHVFMLLLHHLDGVC